MRVEKIMLCYSEILSFRMYTVNGEEGELTSRSRESLVIHLENGTVVTVPTFLGQFGTFGEAIQI